MLKTRLTIRKIEQLSIGNDAIWDTDVPGLHVRALKTGKYFYLYYRNKYGQQRKPSIGRFGTITLEQARRNARIWWETINNGGDPALDKKEARLAENSPTIKDLRDRWLKEHAPTLKTSHSQLNIWNNKILPKIGPKKVRDVTKKDLLLVLDELKGSYYHNRVRALLAKAFNLAEEWGWRDEYTNPCRRIKKKKEEVRRRYMTPDEMKALGAILMKWDQKLDGHERIFASMIRLLMFTGARCGEIMNARWEYIDWHRGVLDLPDSKTGGKEIVLSDAALAILIQLKEGQISDWIIPGRVTDQPLKYPAKLWRRLLEEAKIKNLRIHDLRHTFASIAVSAANGTLPQVGSLLGHSQADTTKRYAHFMLDPKKDLANKTSERIEKWLSYSEVLN